MSEDWQFCFFVKGLVAPEEGVEFDNVLIKGIPPSYEASIFFRVPIKDENDDKEKDEIRDCLMRNLRSIMLVYSLVANKPVEVLSGLSYSRIDSEHAFGSVKLCARLSTFPVFDKERRKTEIPVLGKTITKHGEIAPILQQKKMRFLKNAMDYYSRSLQDALPEEKLIDLMISLESLFSKEVQELRLRISQRTAFFLGMGQESKLPEIFRDVYTLYDKRSKVVHGIEDVKIDNAEISRLTGYIRASIKLFLHIGMSKEKSLDLIDGAIFNEEKKKKLIEILAEAVKKW